MKKIITVWIVLAMMMGLCACGTTEGQTPTENLYANDYENACEILKNYANAVMKAWNYGLKEDCIFEGKNTNGFDDPANVDIERLAGITKIDKTQIETALLELCPEVTKKMVNVFCNDVYASHFSTLRDVERYNTLTWYPELTDDQYLDTCYNVEMIKYLYEKIQQTELDAIMARNASDEKFDALSELKTYIDEVVESCLGDDYTYAFPGNYQTVFKEVEDLCDEVA